MRTTGPPTSSNGASSHHLIWQLPALHDPIVEVSAGFEILVPPSVERLVFWALQASFAEGRRVLGGGHLGLQHHPSYPQSGAVCWGGYHAAGSGRTGELPGGPLFGPSTLRNPNVADYRWSSGIDYRLHITRASDGWTGTIIDMQTLDMTDVRTLHGGGDRLVDPIVWTECFAECDAPASGVRWHTLVAVTEAPDGERIAHDVDRVRVNYQREADGGCSTSDSTASDLGIEQWTGVDRTVAQGSILPVAVEPR